MITRTTSRMASLKVTIVPGNGAGDVTRANWYGWLQKQINKAYAKDARVSVQLRNMPDPVVARESVWLPFMKDELECDENTIIVGHSSGAAAAMRYAERYPVEGIVLVSAYVSDLGDSNEAASGYFNRPWHWEAIRAHTNFVDQFASTDDPFIPWHEQQAVIDGLHPELHKYDSAGHFMNSSMPDLLAVVNNRITAALQRLPASEHP